MSKFFTAVRSTWNQFYTHTQQGVRMSNFTLPKVQFDHFVKKIASTDQNIESQIVSLCQKTTYGVKNQS
jgi:hypothetical protein